MVKTLTRVVKSRSIGDALKAQRAVIGVIARIEMLAWKGHTDESLHQTTALISLLPELPMDEAVIEQAIRIRKTFVLKLPDAVIAATDLVHGLQLMTGNESDFKRVAGLNQLCIWGAVVPISPSLTLNFGCMKLDLAVEPRATARSHWHHLMQPHQIQCTNAYNP